AVGGRGWHRRSAARAELGIRRKGVAAVGARDDRLLADLSPAVRAEVGTPLDRSTAGTADRDALAPLVDGELEQPVDLTQPALDREHLLALLDQEVLLELITAVHLEHEPTEVADPLLPRPDERPALAPERPRRRNAARARRLGRLDLGLALGRSLRGPLAEPLDQCHWARASLPAGQRIPTERQRSMTTTRCSVSSRTE